MGTSPNTLHDFVLELLSDPKALEAFQVDAEGSLAAAGLSDISALDVQEVIPLVLDYAPTAGLPALDGVVLNDLPLDVVEDGTAGAITQLQAVAQQLSLAGVPSTSDVNLAVAGALTADANGLDAFGGLSSWGLVDAVASVDATVAGDFSAVGDVTDTLDGTLHTTTGQVDDLADTATAAAHGAVASVGGVTGPLPGTEGLTSHVFGTVDTLNGVVDGVTGDLTGNLGVDQTLGHVTSHVTSHVTEVTSAAPVAPVVDTVAEVANHTGVDDVVGHVTGKVDALDVPVVDSLGVDDLLF
ncbi:IniB N-terminal domain-containing protein [Saccharothrix coeruleofusca]|uniref:Uncharacterized protein n=1 Tax=Saccharothrix coeruleofusca TaxID=33919 RepID=A0A918AIQ3_9PSEU|nr:IniB N-terminal domain-containing protein [Saccharothrix coeruleofusca]GGP34309.1 hypothetical protein GCM10010185_01090 [Saccharothrix coeruleofusca]